MENKASCNNSDVQNSESTIEIQANILGDNNIIKFSRHDRNISKDKKVVFHLPKLINSFRGRENEMKQLETWFFKENIKTVAICGLPGMGKTELAKQFICKCKDENRVEHILWMNAERQESLEESFKNLFVFLELGKLDNIIESDIGTMVQRVYEYFEDKPVIFVFDNADTRQGTYQYEPPINCLCIITSQVKDWNDDIQSLVLSPLVADSAVDVLVTILQKYHRADDHQLYQALANILDYVPLALQIVAAYVRQEIIELNDEFSLQEYINELDESQEFIDKSIPDWSTNPYKKSIYRAIKISLQKITKINNSKSNLALRILYICSYLNCEKIIYNQFFYMDYINNLLEMSNNKKRDLVRSLSLLDNYSFISISNTRVRIHRLVQEVLRFDQQYCDGESQKHYYNACLELALRNNLHTNTILKYADKNVHTFCNFFIKHMPIEFLEILGSLNCPKTIEAIFKFSDMISNLDTDKRKILIEAAKNGYATVMGYKLTLQELFNVFASLKINIENSSFLQKAAFNGHLSIIELFDIRNSTLIHEAASSNNLDIRVIEYIIKQNEDVNAVNYEGNTPLHCICFNKLDNADIEKNEERIKCIRLLVHHGAKTDIKNIFGETILHVSIGNTELMYFLIEELNIDINAQTNKGNTILHKLITRKNIFNNKLTKEIITIIRKLFNHGANPEIKNNTGETILHLAVCFLNTEFTEFLLNELQTNVNVENNDGLTPLQIMFNKEAYSEFSLLNIKKIMFTIRRLIHHGAITKHRHNDILMHLAIDFNSVELIEFLVDELKIDVNVKNTAGITPLQKIFMSPRYLPSSIGLKDIVQKLLNHGAHCDITTANGDSLLHLACRNLNVILVEFLLHELHFEVNVENNEGWTPLNVVQYNTSAIRRSEIKKITELLMKYESINNIDKIEDLNCTLNKKNQEANDSDSSSEPNNSAKSSTEDWKSAIIKTTNLDKNTSNSMSTLVNYQSKRNISIFLIKLILPELLTLFLNECTYECRYVNVNKKK